MWGQVGQMMRKGFLFQHSHRNMRCRLWFTVTQRQFTQSVGESRVGGKPIRGKEDEKWRDRSWITWNSALPSRNPGNKERNTDSGLCCVRFLCGSMDYSPPGSSVHRTSLVAQMVKNFCVQFRRPGFNLWVGKISWRREWQPLQYSCLENPMDRGAWQGYKPCGCKEVDMTEHESGLN